MPSTELDQRLLATAAEHLPPLAAVLAAADPRASVSPRSRMLCAGLACLARACYAALGGSAHAFAVGEAAATLSLLTKVDDQVIDALEFHGGPLDRGRDRRALDRRTRAYLAPTLASIRAASPATDEPRCLLAARLGAALRALAGDRDRLAHTLDTIALGWEVQVRAARILSSDPARVARAEVEAVTADISGAWLLMITMIGELPEDAARPLTAAEQQGFYGWGLHIQTADAFADLGKDTGDGLVASRPGWLLARRDPSLWRRAFERAELAPLYRGMSEADLDLDLLPAPAQLDALDRALAGLGDIPRWLRWIHGFLWQRWLVHPLCVRTGAEPGFAPTLGEQHGRELGRAWASGRSLAEPSASAGARPCSGR